MFLLDAGECCCLVAFWWCSNKTHNPRNLGSVQHQHRTHTGSNTAVPRTATRWCLSWHSQTTNIWTMQCFRLPQVDYAWMVWRKCFVYSFSPHSLTLFAILCNLELYLCIHNSLAPFHFNIPRVEIWVCVVYIFNTYFCSCTSVYICSRITFAGKLLLYLNY